MSGIRLLPLLAFLDLEWIFCFGAFISGSILVDQRQS